MTAPIRVDTPLSHLRNALQIIELGRPCMDPQCCDGGAHLSAVHTRDVIGRISAAIAQLEAEQAGRREILATLAREVVGG